MSNHSSSTNEKVEFDREEEQRKTELHRKEHPEDYTPAREVWAEAMGKLAAKFGVSRTEAK